MFILTAEDRDKERFLNLGWGWIALTVALALHVTDEALTNFLSV